jgi:galactose mutarotase-like enzyme
MTPNAAAARHMSDRSTMGVLGKDSGHSQECYLGMKDLCFLQNDHLALAVAPMGAEMQYLRTAAGDDLLWHGDAAHWTGRAPVLFPIVGRAVNDTVAANGHSATMKQHGFARRSPFALEQATADMCRHVLRDDADTRAIYPFRFALRITHRLQGASLHVTAHVENTDTVPMPFGFGFHPAFVWPLPGVAGAHHVTLELGGNPARTPLQSDGLLSRDTVPGPFEAGDLALTEDLFAQGALVFADSRLSGLRFGQPEGHALVFSFENLPDFALWKPPAAPFLCIEPWHGTASYANDGPEIAARPNSLVLEPQDSAHFGYSVTLDG